MLTLRCAEKYCHLYPHQSVTCDGNRRETCYNSASLWNSDSIESFPLQHSNRSVPDGAGGVLLELAPNSQPPKTTNSVVDVIVARQSTIIPPVMQVSCNVGGIVSPRSPNALQPSHCSHASPHGLISMIHPAPY
jgi:hypothetical protein